jgi:hypothetical protein
MIARRLSLACLALTLAACGKAEEANVVADHADPLMAAALADQIMIDPDMVNRNGANQLASFADQDGSMPRPDAGPEAAAAARAEAVELVGGSSALRPVPEPAEGQAAPDAALARCAGQAQPGFRWAARMPASFPIYPRGAVLEAAGSDGENCSLRAASFATPVAVNDVLAFYATRASAAGYSVQHTSADGENVLSGGGPAGRLQVRVRPDDGGLVLVDLITLGG